VIEPDIPATARTQDEWNRKAATKLNRLARLPKVNTRSISTSQTLREEDSLVIVTAACTVTLPTLTDGAEFVIKKTVAAGTVTVSGGGKNIDGAASFNLTTQYTGKRITGGPDSLWHITGSF
jgi:hypothetical protein